MGFLNVISVILFVTVTCTAVTAQYGPTSYHVTLSFFSGRQNPVWVIHGDNAINLPTHDTALPSILGYSGFIIEEYQGFQWIRMWTIGRCSNLSLERQLLGTVRGLIPNGESSLLPENVINMVEQSLRNCTNQQ